jgi:hypothetical protein
MRMKVTNAHFVEETDIGEFGRNVDTYEMELSSSFRPTVSNLSSSAPRSPTVSWIVLCVCVYGIV